MPLCLSVLQRNVLEMEQDDLLIIARETSKSEGCPRAKSISVSMFSLDILLLGIAFLSTVGPRDIWENSFE